jgi:hypothetical protein
MSLDEFLETLDVIAVNLEGCIQESDEDVSFTSKALGDNIRSRV